MTTIRKLLQLFLVGILLGAGGAAAQQQQRLYGVNPFGNSAGLGNTGLYYLDAATGAITGGQVITVPARTITGAQGLAWDPGTRTAYAVVRAAAVAGRLLITLDLATGAGTEIGNLGDNFSSIAFRSDGQLFGVTGDGAAVPETLYLINKATAATTLATALGNGNDGEVIAYNPDNGSFYHWSGNGVSVFERIQATAPYTVSPITAGTWDEIFGAVWNPVTSRFLVYDINNIMDSWTITGVRSNAQPAATNDVRGLILLTIPDKVPTLGEWGLALLLLLTLGAGMRALRPRHPG